MEDQSTSTGAPGVTLCGVEATLVVPRALAALALTRDEGALEKGGSGLQVALGAAALFLSWPIDRAWPAKPRPRAWMPGQDLAVWGGDVFDALIEAGADMGELIGLCGTAYTWALTSRLTKRDVDTAGNSSGGLEAP
jgi:hypothetical protein